MQGDRLQDLVQQLQAAIHPADRPHELKQLAQQGVLRPVNKCPDMPDRSLKQLKKLGNETRAMLPSNTHSRLESSDNK